MNEVLNNFSVNKKKMLELSNKGYMTATDLADYLVNKDVPFRNAYQVVGELVKHCLKRNILLKNLKIKEFKKFHPEFEEDIFEKINPTNVVKSRTSIGGTGFDQVEIELKYWKKKLLL